MKFSWPLCLKWIILLRSKITTLSKLKTIDTHETLLAAFVRHIDEQGGEEPQTRASVLSAGVAELRLEVLNQKWIFTLYPHLHPSRKLLEQDYSDKGEKRSLVFLCPHIPDGLASDFRKHGLNHADLNGRLFVKTDHYLLDRQPKGKTYQNPVSDPDLFSLKTSRIIRTLLSHPEKTWTQDDLRAQTSLSPGLISRILKALVSQGYVSVGKVSGVKSRVHYRLLEFDRLLDAWRVEDDWTKRVTLQQFSVLSSDVTEIARNLTLLAGEEKVVFTQWFAAHLRHPYTTPPVVSAYVIRRHHLDLPLGRKVSSGGNLWLLYPEDDAIFRETQKVSGFQLVSDVQIYLDLIRTGLRGPDQAEALREWKGFAR
jgi:DNA-binding MarR family transcriptional regulator